MRTRSSLPAYSQREAAAASGAGAAGVGSGDPPHAKQATRGRRPAAAKKRTEDVKIPPNGRTTVLGLDVEVTELTAKRTMEGGIARARPTDVARRP
jgi:hypothetical protein